MLLLLSFQVAGLEGATPVLLSQMGKLSTCHSGGGGRGRIGTYFLKCLTAAAK